MRQTVARWHSSRAATSWTGSPPATARTIRACWTWNQDRRRQRATASRIGRSAAEIVSGVACRPRMGSLRGGPAFSIAAAPNVLQDFVAGPLALRDGHVDGLGAL